MDDDDDNDDLRPKADQSRSNSSEPTGNRDSNHSTRRARAGRDQKLLTELGPPPTPKQQELLVFAIVSYETIINYKL